MSIKDLENLNSRQMATLQRKHARETSRLTEGHNDLKAEIKKANEGEIVDLQQENIRKIASENEKKEKLIEQMKQHLEQTSKMTDAQIKDLKNNAEKVKQVESEKLGIDRERVKSENDLYLEELNYRFGKEHKKINAENQNQLSTLKENKHHQLAESENHFNNKLNTQTNAFTQRFQADSINQKKIQNDLEQQFKAERFNTNIRQQQDMSKVVNTHNQTLEVRDTQFRKGLKEQDLMFEKKYGDNLKIRNEDLKRLDELNGKVLTKMKSDLKESLQTTVSRSDDPFYRFTELKPTLKEHEDSIQISLEIPDYDKTDIQLTFHDKEAILSFSRRYDDSRKEAGLTNKLHKVESFTSRIMTNHHLDAKSVKSSYQDGVMTYTVKKA